MRVGVHLPQTEVGFGADIGAIKEFVQAAESLGYDHVLTSEHVLGPGVRHEPLVLFGYLASVTTTIKFASWIVVLPSRQATLVAKQTAEVDVLSGGRLRLGVGIGSNRVEYEGMGEAFEDRGVRCEEQIDLLRALWTQELVTFEGRWHKITDAGLNPLPIQRPIPIWMGGGPGSSGSISAGLSERALRRIARVGDGWYPAVRPPEVAAIIARLNGYLRDEGRDLSEMGVEGSVTLAGGSAEDWTGQALTWKELGASDLAVSTGGAGFGSVRQHIDALAEFKASAEGVVQWQ